MQVDFSNAQTGQPVWRADINEVGEVPVLEVDSRWMTQSGAILLYLSEQFDLLRIQDDERNDEVRWLVCLTTGWRAPCELLA